MEKLIDYNYSAKVVDTAKWKEFSFARLFEIRKGKRLTKADMNIGNIKYIGATAFNNGITAKIGNNEYLHPANTITVCYNGSVGEAFYQTEPFWATDDVNVLYPKFELNLYIALFLTALIRKIGKRFCYTNKWTKEIMEKTPILLPATLDGAPDWQFMENYIKRIYESEELQEILSANKNQNRNVDTIQWQEFEIKDLFDLILSKGDNQAKLLENGSIPLVSAGLINNGICKYIQKGDGISKIFKAPCLTIDMFGKTFYQPNDFYSVSHGRVNILLPKFKLTKNIGLFLSGILDKHLFSKYSFSVMCSQTKLKKEKILLPATPAGEPDWQFMEGYIKSLPYSRCL